MSGHSLLVRLTAAGNVTFADTAVSVVPVPRESGSILIGQSDQHGVMRADALPRVFQVEATAPDGTIWSSREVARPESIAAMELTVRLTPTANL